MYIPCKYKFLDKEKFNGKPYCTCFNELCEDISFACDKNCQIYYDWIQLKKLEKECAEQREKINNYDQIFKEILENLKIGTAFEKILTIIKNNKSEVNNDRK